MSGSVYPCEKCKVQNWVTDINDEGVCVKCSDKWATVAEPATIEISSHCSCDEDYAEGCMGEVCYVPLKENFEESIFPEYLKRNGNPSSVKIMGQNMGWQRLTGYMVVEADASKVFESLTINGDWTLKISLAGRNLIITRSSHDEPTGAGFTIEPSTEDIEI